MGGADARQSGWIFRAYWQSQRKIIMKNNPVIAVFAKGSVKQKFFVLFLLLVAALHRAFLGIHGFMVAVGEKMSPVMFAIVYCLTALPSLFIYMLTNKSEQNRFMPGPMEKRRASLLRMF
jgi:hypothetical protein